MRAAALALAFFLLPRPATATCSGLIFRDGFELGDTSRWSNSPASPHAAGSWTFTVDFDGTLRPFALVLIDVSGGPVGEVAGYLLGATSRRVFVRGQAAGGALEFDLELADPSGSLTLTFNGAIGDEQIAGTMGGGVPTQSVTLERTSCELSETQLVAAAVSGRGSAEPEHLRLLAVVTDEDGAFVAGGFVGEDDCELWACDGGLTSFSAAGDTLSIGLETDGGCSAGSALTAAWDAGNGLYSGSFTFTDCSGTTSGSLLAAFGMTTSSRAARELLAARGAIATLLENDATISSPLTPLAPGFLHFGKDEPAIRAELNSEIARYDDIDVELERFRGVRTGLHPRTFPALVEPFGFEVEERRTGIPVAGGPAQLYRDTRFRPLIDDLARATLASGIWKIGGNLFPAIDLPWSYTVSGSGSLLLAPTADGNPVHVSIGPFGAHFSPATGHPNGDAKANFIGFLPNGDAEMEELVGDGDGVRDPGEVWGYPIGGDPSGDRVRLRRPVYRAPLAGAVEKVVYELGPSPIHFDNEPHWRVELALGDELKLRLGHVGRIAPALRALVLAATGVDTDAFAGPPGTDLLAGHDPLAVAAGTELALPQILAEPIPAFPGYWRGGGSFGLHPWAQMEFTVPHTLVAGGQQLGADFCVFRFVGAVRRASLQAVLDADLADPATMRWREFPPQPRWTFAAEGGLCQSESSLPRDFSALYTNLGGWYERAEATTTPNELWSIVPIDRDAAAYDPENYDSPDVTHLVVRAKDPPPFVWTMPDATVVNAFLPAGELLELGTSTMLVKWRDLNLTNPEVYQRAAWLLDAEGVQIEWGNFASSSSGRRAADAPSRRALRRHGRPLLRPLPRRLATLKRSVRPQWPAPGPAPARRRVWDQGPIPDPAGQWVWSSRCLIESPRRGFDHKSPDQPRWEEP